MSYVYSLNNTPANGAQAMWLLITALVTAGWTQVDSGDGVTAGHSAGAVTGGGTGAGGLGNAKAWVRLRCPGITVNGGTNTRELTIQLITANTSWRICYSRAATFSGGSPTYQVCPNASDEQTLLGGGTEASPSGGTAFTTDGSYRFNCVAYDSTAGYGFYYITAATGSTTASYWWAFETLAAGTYPSADLDPTLHSPPSTTYPNFHGTANFSTWFGTSPTWSTVLVGAPGDETSVWQVAAGSALGTNPITGYDDFLPIFFARTSAPTGWKGTGVAIKACCSIARTNYDTWDIGASSKAMIYWQGLALPWGGVTPTI